MALNFHFDPCILAISSICGNTTFTKKTLPQLVRIITKMLIILCFPLPIRVIESICNICLVSKTAKGNKLCFNNKMLFNRHLRPNPIDFGITEKTLLPLNIDIEFTEEQLTLWSGKVEELKLVPKHAQRSPGWFKQREGAITASDFATAVGESKYDKPNDLLMKKCGRGAPFRGNKYTRHGQIFEDAALYVYQKMYGKKVYEFGLMPHGAIKSHSRETIKIVAASPDGISENGIMLEIKCPFTREIQHYHPTKCGVTTGDKDIVPHGYYSQMQLQLECCDLEVCDFMECNIKEFLSSEDFYTNISDECPYKTKEGKIKSCILEYRDLSSPGSQSEIKFHIEYPPDIYIHGQELKEWMKKTIISVQTDTLRFQRPIYYWVEDISIFRVYRDQNFFKERLPKVQAFWKRVEEARVDPSILDELEKKHKPRQQNKKSLIKRDVVLALCQDDCLLSD